MRLWYRVSKEYFLERTKIVKRSGCLTIEFIHAARKKNFFFILSSIIFYISRTKQLFLKTNIRLFRIPSKYVTIANSFQFSTYTYYIYLGVQKCSNIIYLCSVNSNHSSVKKTVGNNERIFSRYLQAILEQKPYTININNNDCNEVT